MVLILSKSPANRLAMVANNPPHQMSKAIASVALLSFVQVREARPTPGEVTLSGTDVQGGCSETRATGIDLRT